MICLLYCSVRVILCLKKKAPTRSSEQNAFALIHHGVKECNKWHTDLKKRYRLQFFFSLPFVCRDDYHQRIFSLARSLFKKSIFDNDIMLYDLCDIKTLRHNSYVEMDFYNETGALMYVYACARVCM
ncbi:hypothetical protein ACS0PU_011244 [Formica fusca]